ncbi:hypothetical protein CTT39_07325 [Agrobacterium rosae]|nr:hypothetical protein CTT39_07325 [Agrobacterium rosae]
MEVTVYIVRCCDGSYYTGLTKQSVEARVWEHNAGIYDGYTSKRRPVELVFTETYDRIVDAIERERQIKGWSRRKKEALIAMAYETLPELSRRDQRSLSNQLKLGAALDGSRLRPSGCAPHHEGVETLRHPSLPTTRNPRPSRLRLCLRASG